MSQEGSSDTRDRILASAGSVFASKGYKDATVRDICQAAGVNLAAVNYHFGDKERLYIESVKRAHRDRMEQAPLPDWSPATPPEQRLRDFVRILLTRMLEDPVTGWHAQLMMRELLQPTAACVELVRDYIRPQFELLLEILDRLLPGNVSLEDRHLIGFSIVGQCLYHRVAQPIVRVLVDPDEYQTYDIELLADHITRWSLAALAQFSGHETSHAAVARQGATR